MRLVTLRKTMTTTNVALTLAMWGDPGRVVVLDCDLQFGDVRHIPNATIVEHVQDTLRGKPVLLLSDEYDKDLISRLEAVASRVVCWSNESRSEDGVVDMLTAVPAQEFFGTPLSTFSSGIVKLRKRAGTHTTIRYTHPYKEESIPDWGRV